jgi:hypothetical protein
MKGSVLTDPKSNQKHQDNMYVTQASMVAHRMASSVQHAYAVMYNRLLLRLPNGLFHSFPLTSLLFFLSMIQAHIGVKLVPGGRH